MTTIEQNQRQRATQILSGIIDGCATEAQRSASLAAIAAGPGAAPWDPQTGAYYSAIHLCRIILGAHYVGAIINPEAPRREHRSPWLDGVEDAPAPRLAEHDELTARNISMAAAIDAAATRTAELERAPRPGRISADEAAQMAEDCGHQGEADRRWADARGRLLP